MLLPFTPFKGVCQALIDTLLDGSETAHDGTRGFDQRDYLCYNEALIELASVIKAPSESSYRQPKI